MMAGWGSNNKFALLGAMRAVAQMVSYEIPAVMALVGVVLLTGTMSMAVYPELQSGIPIMGDTLSEYGVPDLGLGWFVFTPVGFVGFILFYIAVLAEGERTPFDIPEADSEIVAGYMTEYSGMKFAVFYLGQFVLNYALSMIAAIAFLGGWQGPGVGLLVATGEPFLVFLGSALSVLYLMIKAWFLFFVMIWLRGAFPRLRVDQLMGFAWKFLLPMALVNIFSIAIWVSILNWGSAQGLWFLDDLELWMRQLIAFVVTALINGLAYYGLLQLNARPKGLTGADLAEEQAFGTIGLPQR
jgi:NADH-quinone oxidoreductase subunit H